jgi:hypothetical protein
VLDKMNLQEPQSIDDAFWLSTLRPARLLINS